MKINNLPSDAAITEALRRGGHGNEFSACQVRKESEQWSSTIQLARMIEKYEPETLVDPDLLVVREIVAAFESKVEFPMTAESLQSGDFDHMLKKSLEIFKASKGV